MIDIHTHVWEALHWSDAAKEEYRLAYGKAAHWDCPPAEHWQAMAGVDKAVVFAMMMKPTGLIVPNDYVHAYVKQHPDKLIGLASVDPKSPEAVNELERAVNQLGFRGLKLSGAYQDFNPAETRYDPIYRRAEELGIPIFWHQSTTFFRDAPLRWSTPMLLDEVAQRFPRLCMNICHVGHPWNIDAVMVVRKHRNVYADISGFGNRRWRFYEALRTAVEYGVADKLLFGSDYPIATVDATVQALRNAQQLAQHAGLPEIPRDVIENMLNRNSLKLLGME